MDQTAILTTFAVALSIFTLAAWRMRKGATARKPSGGKAASSSGADWNSRTDGVALTHPKVGP
jgi:hypothetical protein